MSLPIQSDKLDQFYSYSSSNVNYETQKKKFSQLDFKNLLIKLLGQEEVEQFKLEQQLSLNDQHHNQDQQVVSIPIYFHPTLYGISIDIIYKQNQICIKSYLTKMDLSPLYASDKNIINLISFYALKQNDKLHNGSLSIDPFTGLFQFKTLVNISFYEQINFSENFLECLRFNIQEHKEVMKDQIPYILYQMNKIKFKQFCKFVKQDQLQNKQKQFDYLKEIFQKKLFIEMSDQEKLEFLDHPKPKSLPLLTEILVQSNIEDLKTQFKEQPFIKSGGYSEIRKIELSYNIIDYKQTICRSLAVKTNKIVNYEKNNQNKVKKELEILKQLSKTTKKATGEGNIVTCYYDQKLENDCYFMEFYNNGSLEQYASSRSIVLSLRTKLFILAGIINGIDFLHLNGIAHLDLKLGNILIQKQLIPKICDFGEAKSFEELNQNKMNFSRTLPYAAPELYNDYKISPAFDIFSFGILMCNLIFEQQPFNYNPDDLSNLEQRFKSNTYAIKQNLFRQIKQGPKKIMKMILHLIVLCLQPDPEIRPKPKWILSILWKIISFIDNF
ncbi:unnamed protein product [Paramecium sonneborni]|uniref:Protein kinase domain-containing protein n=1 Tax=Paramecium sonneborni TaxID=65129 RepID=A0A8S1KT31_9CILI|nr:unnamed protein product [Paramecium sonneborni]